MSRFIPTTVSAIAGGTLGVAFWMHGMPILSIVITVLFTVITAFCAFGSQESWDRWFWWLSI